MARRYDSKTTIFSPEGRLYQVEYAMEAISHAGTCLGIMAEDGVLLAAEKRNVHKLLDDSVLNEKIYRLSNNISCTVAGITSDANVLINHLRWWAANYRLRFGEEMPVEQLVQELCNEKQRFTQRGGKRPFGVSLLYAGWDKHYGYQLYQSDPSGNYTGWKATCIGNNHAAAVSLLKQEYKEQSLEDAKKLAIKVLWKTLDVKLASEKIEMAVLKRKDGKTVLEELTDKELETLIAEHEKKEKEAETMAEKMPTPSDQTELAFLRLLERTKKLCDNVETNAHKIQAAAGQLEALLNKMHELNKAESNELVQYTRELNQLRIISQVAMQKSAENKLQQIERIPKLFPLLNGGGKETEEKEEEIGEQLQSSNEIKLKNKTIYEQELRDELFHRIHQDKKEIKHDEMQEQMANELLSLTRSLKENMKVAGNVIKDDNQRLVRMQQQVDSNEERLSAESVRLARHAYKCGFDCMLVFIVFFIFISFIWMVLVMKIFPKVSDWRKSTCQQSLRPQYRCLTHIHMGMRTGNYNVFFEFTVVIPVIKNLCLEDNLSNINALSPFVLMLAVLYSVILELATSPTSQVLHERNHFKDRYTEEQKLLDYILFNYEKAVRPVKNSSSTVVVKLGMTLTNLFDMDERNQVLTINVWLDQWNPADFNNIKSIRIPCDLIWLPDIVLYNSADDYTTGYMKSRAMLDFDGTVFWPPPTQLRSTCKVDVTLFPFDYQKCSLKFGSWTYHGFQLDITNRSNNIDLSMFVQSGEFDLVKVGLTKNDRSKTQSRSIRSEKSLGTHAVPSPTQI
ncbi:hypothetical protein WR25_27000 isoform G [Diploscapter pachys]|uniref:Proteasome subunit alpha type-4 n=1 Tax=Diploscapter pachys TaxID=2018661 RepID=A0A2A2L7D0_9BILA|nr:hypothetical protein WR25_27000 isoform B [Diploscapter pachys]PAV82087.1 hypothetical protein WR25_27000 isoform G [Diploscapter pachys]